MHATLTPMVPRVRSAVLGLLAALGATSAVHADGGRPMPPLLPKYQQECAACHMAFPPGALPAASWQRVMQNLPRHYGTDASLDAATQQSIGDWLLAHAGSGKRVRSAPPDDRITRGDWFIREHREVPKAAWTRPAIKSASNCSACHRGANEGDYDEDRVGIPR